MCAHYTYNKDEAKFRLREKIEVFGAVPRANLRPTDLGPVILPEYAVFETSPAIHGWVHGSVMSPVPSGTKEMFCRP